MFTGRKKIVKPDGVSPDEFEELVAQELFNLEVSAADIKMHLKDLYITAARQIDISGRSKAIIIFVPYRLLQKYHRIQQKLIRELEKKFSGRHVVIIAQRTILNKNCRRSKKISGPRPRSRTLTHVHEAILEVGECS
jgi:small subunit ribosomal protein S7e